MYGKSIHEIFRLYGHSRKTVRKALKGIEPKYRRTSPVSPPTMGPYLTIVEQWLQKDMTVRKKQRHTAKHVFTRLVEDYEFEDSESTVRACVRQIKKKLGMGLPEAMIPLNQDIER